jgi:hypothetical protein
MSGGGLSMGSGGRMSGIDGCSIMATIFATTLPTTAGLKAPKGLRYSSESPTTAGLTSP